MALKFTKGGRSPAGDRAPISTPTTAQLSGIGYALKMTSHPGVDRMQTAFPISKLVSCTATPENFLVINMTLFTSA